MATKSVTSIVQSTSLEQNLGRTVMGEYVSDIDKIILRLLQGNGQNVCVPTLEYLLDTLPGLQSKLIDIYNMNMGLQEGVQNIPDELKASQGALFDGLCFGYDMRDDTYALYTLNFNLLNLMGNTGVNMIKQCIEKNIKGEVKGYRIDIEYTLNSDSFSCKPVNHRKPIDDSDEGVKLIPYIVIARMMKIVENMLSGGSVLKTVQEVGELYKIRCISKNEKALVRFCDSPSAVKGLECSFFPLKAFFYAPVLGAPSTTSMVTNVNMFRLCELRILKTVTQVKELGVEKPKNPIVKIITEGLIVSKLMSLKGNNPVKLMELINSFPKAGNLLGGLESAEKVSSTILTKYLHSITKSERQEVVCMIPNCKEELGSRLSVFLEEGIELPSERLEEMVSGVSPEHIKEFNGRVGKLFKDAVEIPAEGFDGLRDILKTNICKFTIRKKDCTLSSVIGTNSRELLAKIYGKDYFKQYESFGVRLDAVLREYSQHEGTVYGLSVALMDNGFSCSKEQVKQIANVVESGIDLFGDRARKEIAEILGEKTSSRSHGNGVMLRTLDAYISEKDNGDGTSKSVVNDYYRVVDADKIVSAMILA